MATLADYGPRFAPRFKAGFVEGRLQPAPAADQVETWSWGPRGKRFPAVLHTPTCSSSLALRPALRSMTPSSMVVCDLDGTWSTAPKPRFSGHRFPRYIYRQHGRRLRCRAHPLHLRHPAWAATGQKHPCGLTMMGDEFGGPVAGRPVRSDRLEAIGKGVVETLKKYRSPAVSSRTWPFTIGKDAERRRPRAAAMDRGSRLPPPCGPPRQLGEHLRGSTRPTIDKSSRPATRIVLQVSPKTLICMEGVLPRYGRPDVPFVRLRLPRLADTHIKSALTPPARWCLGSPL